MCYIFPKKWILEISIKMFHISGSVSGSRLKAVFGYPGSVANLLSCQISNRQTGQWSSLPSPTSQRCSDSVFLLFDPILFLKNDIRIWSQSCFGWNNTDSMISTKTGLGSDLSHEAKYLLELFCLLLNMIGWSNHMRSLEYMSCSVDHDIGISSVPPAWKSVVMVSGLASSYT